MKTGNISLVVTLALLSCIASGSAAGDVDPRMQDMFDQYQAATGEILFNGKVVDQDGEPVAEAAVSVSMPIQVAIDAPPQGRARTILTDSNGCFEVSKHAFGLPDLMGHDLMITGIRKLGYESEEIPLENRGFSFSRSNTKRFVADKSNPVIFHMRKKGACTFLLEEPYWQMQMVLGSSNVTCGYDIIQNEVIEGVPTSQVEGALTCDLWVTVTAHANDATRQIVFAPAHANGGILGSNQLLHEAPEHGYLPEFVFTGQTDGQVATKYLYLKSRDPAIYTRIEIMQLTAGEGFCRIQGRVAANPYGDRNLEPKDGLSYDETKLLTDEVRAAFRQNKLPAQPDF